MRSCVCRQVLLALMVLLVCYGGSARAADGGDSEPVSSSLPSAPEPSLSVHTHAFVRHPAHVIVPMLDAEPKLADFLVSPPASKAARQMLRIGNFVERYPKDGKPATEPTVAYLGYTREYFYAAFVCKDRTPGSHPGAHAGARFPGRRRFCPGMLDTFNDQRRAFLFADNALGIQADGLYSEQNGTDYSFDTVWDTWGKRTPSGYVVLLRIPFSSLYFAKAGPGEMRTWGIILQRNISHANESAYWPRNSHNIAGVLTQDIAADGFTILRTAKICQFEPYALGRNLRQLNTVDPNDPYFEHKHLQAYAGLDAKFILHNSLVLDTTSQSRFQPGRHR